MFSSIFFSNRWLIFFCASEDFDYRIFCFPPDSCLFLCLSFIGGASDKEPTCQYRRCERCGFDPWVTKISWRRKWQPTPVLLPGEFHGQRSLVDYMGSQRAGHDWSDLAHTSFILEDFFKCQPPLILQSYVKSWLKVMWAWKSLPSFGLHCWTIRHKTEFCLFYPQLQVSLPTELLRTSFIAQSVKNLLAV